MSQKPFMFCITSEGNIYHPGYLVLGTEYGLQKILDMCVRVGDKKHLAAASAIEQVLQNGVIAELYLDQDAKRGDSDTYSTNPYSREKHFCLVVVGPKEQSSAFDPQEQNEETGFSANKRSWGWDAALGLLPHQRLIEKLAQNLDVTFDAKLLSSLDKWSKQNETGDFYARQPSVENDLGRSGAFAVFCVEDQKYVSKKGKGAPRTSTLGGAMLFETKSAAEEWAKQKKGQPKLFTVVQLEVRLRSVCTEELDPQSLGVLNEAMAQMNKEEINQALKDCTIEQLEERLAQSGQSLHASSKPKKM